MGETFRLSPSVPSVRAQCSQYFLKLGMRFRAVGLVAVRFERKADAPKVQRRFYKRPSPNRETNEQEREHNENSD